MISLDLDIDFGQLNSNLAQKLKRPGTETAASIVGNLILEQYEYRLKQMVISGTLSRFKIEWVRGPLGGMLYPYPMIDLVTKPDLDMGYVALKINIPLNEYIDIKKPLRFTTRVPIEVKYQVLKKAQNVIIKLKGLEINGLYLKPAITDIINTGCGCPTETLIPYISGVWDWALRFICKTCGKVLICECFHKAFDTYYPQALAELSTFSEGSRVHEFVELYKRAEYRSGICHICREVPSDLFYCHPMYGSKIMVHYGPYVKRYSIENNISEKEAEDYIRGSLGVSQVVGKWVSEVELLKIVRDIFPEEKVLYQSSPEWLSPQRFDVYIPSLQLAIEYQGRQHFEPVDFFGGQAAFVKTQERDKKKARLSASNNVTLLYFQYDEQITPKMVKERIKRALQIRR